ncbi:hypothetical protein N7471_011599 [Penicillium samsonianum]|uniref:uncharacterized protein n=1 Tax=Penicillium samsonianum TaxID=1882272 RepID=UPI002547E6B7|nr:uncharacterized protein N7471_011599 [Penicillium samsonianum]KAJ6124282.1 hypothetical protein N7471_011599 [Penicillium samsonianum]
MTAIWYPISTFSILLRSPLRSAAFARVAAAPQVGSVAAAGNETVVASAVEAVIVFQYPVRANRLETDFEAAVKAADVVRTVAVGRVAEFGTEAVVASAVEAVEAVVVVQGPIRATRFDVEFDVGVVVEAVVETAVVPPAVLLPAVAAESKVAVI